MTTEPSPAIAISTKDGPAALGPYSQAVRAGAYIYVSGQTPINPATGEIEDDTITGQALQAINNIAAILAAADASLDDVVKTTVLLANMADFAEVNAVYARCFTGGILPARATYQVAALPKAALIEIEAIAYKPV